MHFNDKLKELMEIKGLTKNALANELEITPAAVYKWTKDVNPSTPTWDNIEKIIEIMDVSPKIFFTNLDWSEITQEQRELLKDWDSLMKPEKEAVRNIIKIIKQKRIENYKLQTRK